MERPILENISTKQDEWSCAYPAYNNFVHHDGHGLYGKKDYVVYYFGDNHMPGALEWKIVVWRDSEGVHLYHDTKNEFE